MTDEPFISVLSPFYNIRPFLAECIESVLAQSHRNFEYILVDNHSTDGSVEVANDYARRDSRIRVMRADLFRDQIPNYNYSLRQISSNSRYVKIVQADDWIHPRCIADFVALAEANPSVALVSSYDLRGTQIFGTGLSADQRVLSGREAARLYFQKWLFLFGSQTTVMYRADVVRARRLFYPEGTMHADTEVIFELLRNHDFGFVHQVLSFTRLRDDSISGKLQNMADAALDRLIITKRFGQLFLDPAEYEEVLRGTLGWYYDELARRWLTDKGEKRSEAFWAYHRKGLTTVGEKINRKDLVRAAGRIALRSALNPGRFVARLG